MSLLSGRMNIEFFPGWKKIRLWRISFVLGYLRMILWKISTAIYLYGFLNQSLGLILGNIFFFIKITACMPLNSFCVMFKIISFFIIITLFACLYMYMYMRVGILLTCGKTQVCMTTVLQKGRFPPIKQV